MANVDFTFTFSNIPSTLYLPVTNHSSLAALSFARTRLTCSCCFFSSSLSLSMVAMQRSFSRFFLLGFCNNHLIVTISPRPSANHHIIIPQSPHPIDSFPPPPKKNPLTPPSPHLHDKSVYSVTHQFFVFVDADQLLSENRVLFLVR